MRSALVMSHLRSSRKQRQRPLAEVPEGPCPSSREVHETIARDVRHRAAAMAGSMVSDFFFTRSSHRLVVGAGFRENCALLRRASTAGGFIAHFQQESLSCKGFVGAGPEP